MKKSYSEKLRDPRWQKKRLEIFQRDNWTCRFCGNTQETLNVHHLSYHRSGNPWDTRNEDLLTLCHVCHEGESLRGDYEHDLLLEMKRCLFDMDDVRTLASAVISLNKDMGNKFKFIDLVASISNDPTMLHKLYEFAIKNYKKNTNERSI